MASFLEYSLKVRDTLVEVYNNTIGRLIASLFKRKSSVIFLGIDNAGKTTLVNKLKYNANHVYMPTKHAKTDTIEIGNLTAYIIDVGGHEAARIAWKDYLYDVDGIVFIVDTADEPRFEEVRSAWSTVIEISRDVPVLILMNKIDLYGESPESIRMNGERMEKLERATGVYRSSEGKRIEIVYTSVLYENTYSKDSELYKGFEWLSERINERQEQKKQGL